jgi:hypothetical protein
MKTLCYVVCLLSLVSCELVTEVKVPVIPSRLVVNGVYVTDSSFYMQVSRSHHILDDVSPPELKDIEATISDDAGHSLAIDVYGVDPHASTYYFGQGDYRMQAGHTYTITVRAPGFKPVSASSRAPQVVGIVDAKVDSANLVPASDNSPECVPIEFTYRDPPGSGDFFFPGFYVIFVRNSYDSAGNVSGTFESAVEYRLTRSIPTESFADLGRPERVVLDDKALDGELRIVRLYASVGSYRDNGPSSPKWKVTLTHTYEEYVRYIRSVEMQRSTDENPFAQPVQIFTNIGGGMGIFAGLAVSQWDQE